MTSTARIRVSIVGGSGYTGGELIRLLLFHPQVEIAQVASGSRAGHFVHSTHPNLRKQTALRYCHPNDLKQCDLLFLCLPHGVSQEQIEHYRSLAPRVIDLAGDFRLRSADFYQHWYGHEHKAAQLLTEAVYGLPELHRAEMAEATFISGVGCMATTSILGLFPLYRAGIVNQQIPLVVEAKVGSSAAGATPGASSHHPDRSGAVRSFEPTGHRHTAELIQELGLISSGSNLSQTVAFSATAIELVRGILVTAHVFVNDRIDEKALWRIYREAYNREPFLRLIKEKTGVYRYPEPKILAGSNFCDVGFELDVEQQRVVVISALDNLMKGAAGTAVQTMNCMYGWEETLGLTFPGLHPV
jgi:N-acetyl-gamma-glutamyl-phosphate/LysW-gamma-L-alpha-aminoadipyl-6-phosphate reductase